MNQLLLEILILAGASTALVSLCLRFNIPSIVGFIFTGMLVGPSGLGLVAALPDVTSLTEWVGMLLMFTIGLEFNRQKIVDLKHQFMRLGPTQVIGTVALTVFAGRALTPFSWTTLLIWGLLFSVSSTALVLKLLYDNRDVRSPHGQNSLGILVFQDIAVIPMLMFLPMIAKAQSAATSINYLSSIIWLSKSLGVVLAALAIGRYLLPWLLGEIVRRRSQELFFFAVLFVGLAAGEAFHLSGLSASLGAFVAGFMIAESDFGNHTASVFVPLRDALLGLFFASVGTLIDFPFLVQQWQGILSIAAAGFLLKTSVLYIVCRVFRSSNGTSIITALTLAQVGEFSFILAARSIELGMLSRVESQYFMSVSVLSMIATPFLYRVAPALAKLMRHEIWSDIWPGKDATSIAVSPVSAPSTIKSEAPVRLPPKTEVVINPTIIIGYGIAGENVARALLSLNVPLHVIEMNYAILKTKKQKGINIHFGDATQVEVLRHAGIDQAKLVVITVSSDVSIPRIIEVIRNERPDIEIIVRVQFVKQALGLRVDTRTKVIVAEVETALELLSEVLRFYGAEDSVLTTLLSEARETIAAFTEVGADRERRVMNFPRWAIGPGLTPYRVEQEDFVCGKSLAVIDLPHNVGASIAVIFRQGFGASVPRGDFIVDAGDILHLLIVSTEKNLVRDFLKCGRTQ